MHEQFITDTTDYADIVLPATSFFEHKDLQTAYGHYYLQVSDQAIEPLGECRSNVEVFRALAEGMGFDDECFRESVDEMIDSALDSDNPWLRGITRERLQHEGQFGMNFEETTFRAAGTQAPRNLIHRFCRSRMAISSPRAARRNFIAKLSKRKDSIP